VVKLAINLKSSRPQKVSKTELKMQLYEVPPSFPLPAYSKIKGNVVSDSSFLINLFILQVGLEF
jgi:hypothetical protein